VTNNKIPTDEDLHLNFLGCESLDEAYEHRPYGFCHDREGIDSLIRNARAAGRQEGLDEAAKIAEDLSAKSLPNALLGFVIGKDAILAANVIAKAIRTQEGGEGEKNED